MRKISKLLIVIIVGLVVLISLPPLLTRGEDGGGLGSRVAVFLGDFITYIPIIEKAEDTVEPTFTPTATPPDMPPYPTNTSIVIPPNPTSTPTPTRVVSTATPTSTLEPTPSDTPNPPPDGLIWVDHNSVALFDSIPPEYLEAAKNLKMLFSDRSVGANIDIALNCLTAPSWGESPAYCRNDYYDDEWHYRNFSQVDYEQGLVPDRILFEPDPVTYNRDNWTYEFRMGTWNELTEDFITNLAPSYINSKDVLSYQFSYVNVGEGDSITDPESGFFADTPDFYDVHDLEDYIAAHPDKIFIFWTTSLARAIGSNTSTDFNNMMRQYAIDHNKIMFDVADIEAHTDLGAACFDYRDGIEYCDQNSGNCENFPDDGLDLPAICQDWTTEIHGGHLGSVSGGQIILAKAFWVLMAQIAGWTP